MQISAIFEKYIEEVRTEKELTKSTLNCEQKFFDKYIAPVMGSKEPDEVQDADIIQVLDRARNSGRARDTLNRLKHILQNLWDYGIATGQIQNNLPRRMEDEINTFLKSGVYTTDDVLAVKEAFKRMPLGNLYGFVLEQECSPAQAEALTEDSVMLEEHVCLMDRTLVFNEDGGGNPRFEYRNTGVTWMHLSDKACDYIRKQIKLQAVLKRRAGESWNNPSNLLFTDGYGNPLMREDIRKANEELRRHSGIPMLTLDRLKNFYGEVQQDQVSS